MNFYNYHYVINSLWDILFSLKLFSLPKIKKRVLPIIMNINDMKQIPS